jgi:hypothetical protein
MPGVARIVSALAMSRTYTSSASSPAAGSSAALVT